MHRLDFTTKDKQELVNRLSTEHRRSVCEQLTFAGLFDLFRANMVSGQSVRTSSIHDLVTEDGRCDGLRIQYNSTPNSSLGTKRVNDEIVLSFISAQYYDDNSGFSYDSGFTVVTLSRYNDTPNLICLNVANSSQTALLGISKELGYSSTPEVKSHVAESTSNIYEWIFSRHPEMKYQYLNIIEAAILLG